MSRVKSKKKVHAIAVSFESNFTCCTCETSLYVCLHHTNLFHKIIFINQVCKCMQTSYNVAKMLNLVV